jgi:uncharacterized DUF497 family protein
MVAYEWDPVKARRNLQKHGVDFADAVGVFEDEYALTMRVPRRRGNGSNTRSEDEKRI